MPVPPIRRQTLVITDMMKGWVDAIMKTVEGLRMPALNNPAESDRDYFFGHDEGVRDRADVAQHLAMIRIHNQELANMNSNFRIIEMGPLWTEFECLICGKEFRLDNDDPRTKDNSLGHTCKEKQD